jgi:hypothetical protein
MKTLILMLLLLACAYNGEAQGMFIYDNISAPTRIGSLNGPLAGTNTWGQMLLGLSENSLVAIGYPQRHSYGTIDERAYTAEGIPPLTPVYIQMAAWSDVWGPSINDVPVNQVGKSDVYCTWLTTDPAPIYAPYFTIPAVVPVPEPTILSAVFLGFILLCLQSCCRAFFATRV